MANPSVTLSTLRGFEAAARRASFALAANELHLSHSAVSHQIKLLEAELGQQYVQRTIGAMQTPVFGMKPDQLMRAQVDQATQNVDSLVTAMRKIADAFRHTIEESSQALFDGAPKPAAEQSFAASIHIDDPVVRRKPAAAEPIAAG